MCCWWEAYCIIRTEGFGLLTFYWQWTHNSTTLIRAHFKLAKSWSVPRKNTTALFFQAEHMQIKNTKTNVEMPQSLAEYTTCIKIKIQIWRGNHWGFVFNAGDYSLGLRAGECVTQTHIQVHMCVCVCVFFTSWSGKMAMANTLTPCCLASFTASCTPPHGSLYPVIGWPSVTTTMYLFSW